MKKFLLIILFFLLSNKSFAAINIGVDCANLVNQLGGLRKVDILWLENLNQKKYQYVLINLSKKNIDKKFYLCGNKHNINSTSDNTMTVLSERNLLSMTYNSADLFTEIFSVTSKESRKYIMQRLNLKDFGISRNQLNQSYIAGLMKLNEKIEVPKEKTKKITKKQTKKITKINNKQKFIKEIESLNIGDYYVFGHSTNGEMFWGSTTAINNKVQAGKAGSSKNKSCYIRSEQKTNSAPFNGTFILKCTNERIDGSWTQNSAFSPGIGQGFSDNGDVVTAFFAKNKSSIIEFANKYFDQSTSEITRIVEPKQKEIKTKIIKDIIPPKIIIAKNLTFEQSSYKLEGRVEDEGSKNIYVEIDGVIQNAKNGKFVFERFSPVDEVVKIVAIDQWGNKSKEKIVKIKINTVDKTFVKKLEKLNPKSKIFNQLSSDKVAIIIGIEKYDKAPQATYASADAKFFHEYARLAFGVPKENIKLLTDEKATYIDTLALLKKWLPAKINKNKTELIIFFAGHGLANTESENNELYILSQNSDPDMLDGSAISRTKFFKSILDLEPRKVTIFIDACYSGVSRDEKTLLASARPIKLKTENSEIPDMFTVFSASGLNEISSGLKEAKHGIFSYYLMKGLEGYADFNEDKKITNGELLSYMKKNVSVKAAELGRKQNPSFSGDPEKVLISYR